MRPVLRILSLQRSTCLNGFGNRLGICCPCKLQQTYTSGLRTASESGVRFSYKNDEGFVSMFRGAVGSVGDEETSSAHDLKEDSRGLLSRGEALIVII